MRSATLVAVLTLVAACADQAPKQSLNQQPQVPPPVLGTTPQPAPANAATAQAQPAAPVVNTAQMTPPPALAAPQPNDVPVPAYGPNPHPSYYHPPAAFGMPGLH